MDRNIPASRDVAETLRNAGVVALIVRIEGQGAERKQRLYIVDTLQLCSADPLSRKYIRGTESQYIQALCGIQGSRNI